MRRIPAGYQYDYVFDWTILKYQQTQSQMRPPAGPGGLEGGGEGQMRAQSAGGGAGPSGTPAGWASGRAPAYGDSPTRGAGDAPPY